MAYLNYENKRGSGKKLKVHFDLPDDDDDDFSSWKHSRSSVSSESSIDSDDTDNDNSIDKADSKYGFYDSSVGNFQGGSVTQSSVIQYMSSPGPSYDPNIIPSSIFGNKSTSPMEWSVASNDSLFSIQLGNNSFSRDTAFAFNNKFEGLPKTSDFSSMPETLSPVQEVTYKDKNMNMERHSVSLDSSSETTNSDEGLDQEKPISSHQTTGSVREVVNLNKEETPTEVGTNEIVLDKTPDDHSKEAKNPDGEAKNYTSASFYMVESNMSAHSIQFPILASEGGRTSSPTVESEKQEKSEKQEQEQQLETPQEPPSSKTEKTPKQSGRSWCFCFSCSPCF